MSGEQTCQNFNSSQFVNKAPPSEPHLWTVSPEPPVSRTRSQEQGYKYGQMNVDGQFNQFDTEVGLQLWVISVLFLSSKTSPGCSQVTKQEVEAADGAIDRGGLRGCGQLAPDKLPKLWKHFVIFFRLYLLLPVSSFLTLQHV